jgi:hypothetical protein
MQTYTPVTNRFQRLSEADVRADAAFEKHRVSGGPFLHELHPCAQYCIYELTERIAKLEADARALWAVRVLDRWAERSRFKRYTCSRADTAPYLCQRFWMVGDEKRVAQHFAPTPDAARIAAAEALVAEDPSLGDGL